MAPNTRPAIDPTETAGGGADPASSASSASTAWLSVIRGTVPQLLDVAVDPTA